LGANIAADALEVDIPGIALEIEDVEVLIEANIADETAELDIAAYNDVLECAA
jgi:hypothetical protein